MSAPNIASAQPWPQAALSPRSTHVSTHMRVSLAFVEHRVNVYLRFGHPVREIVLDRWRRVAVLAPGMVCCRIKWLGNDYGTALWQLMVLQAPVPIDDTQRDVQRIAGVLPGARILVVSALSDRSTALRAMARGAHGFLLKPFSDEQMVESLQELMA